VRESGAQTANRDDIQSGNDIVLYEPILIVKFLKSIFLEAKGFDSSNAQAEFQRMFLSRTGKDTGGTVLSASNTSRGFPYLSPWRNVGDSGFGL